MSPVEQWNPIISYKPMVIDLAPITVETESLAEPTADQRNHPTATLQVSMTHRGVTVSQPISPMAQQDVLLVFGPTLEENAKRFEESQLNSGNRLKPAVVRATKHVARSAVAGAVGGAGLGAAAGAAIAAGPPGWIAVGIGAFVCCMISGGTSAIDAWDVEAATWSLQDLATKYAVFWTKVYDINQEGASIDRLANGLKVLWQAGERLGGAARDLFNDAEKVLTSRAIDRHTEIYERFLEILAL